MIEGDQRANQSDDQGQKSMANDNSNKNSAVSLVGRASTRDDVRPSGQLDTSCHAALTWRGALISADRRRVATCPTRPFSRCLHAPNDCKKTTALTVSAPIQFQIIQLKNLVKLNLHLTCDIKRFNKSENLRLHFVGYCSHETLICQFTIMDVFAGV